MMFKLNWSKASLEQLITIMRYEECSDRYKVSARAEMKRRIS